jgi:hypothetical protein
MSPSKSFGLLGKIDTIIAEKKGISSNKKRMRALNLSQVDEKMHMKKEQGVRAVANKNEVFIEDHLTI